MKSLISSILVDGQDVNKADLRAYLEALEVAISANAPTLGAIGDGEVDDTRALQAAIDYAIEHNKKLILRSGRYKITAPLFIWKSKGTLFVTFTMEADPGSYLRTDSVVLAPAFNDLPALIIQGARAVNIRGIAVEGRNNWTASLEGHYDNLVNEAMYVTDGCRDSRYSPHCCVAIDPFGTSVPPDGGYPGLSDYYSRDVVMSSHINFERCTFRYGVVGVAALAPRGSNTDLTHYIDCDFEHNKVALALGHAQMKCVQLSHCSIYGSMTAIDGSTYADRNGAVPIINGLNIGGTKFLFNVPSGNQSQAVTGLYAESFLSIGYLGGALAAGTQALAFNGCHFQFHMPTNSKAVDAHLFAYRALGFHGCGFAANDPGSSLPIRVIKDSAAPVAFRSCAFECEYAGVFALAIAGIGDMHHSGVNFDQCYVRDSLNPSGRDIFSSRRDSIVGLYNFMTPYGASIQSAQDSAELLMVSTAIKNIPIGNAIPLTISGSTAMFTAPDSSILRVGDQVFTSTGLPARNQLGAASGNYRTPIGVITAMNGSEVTCKGAPEQLASGSHSLYLTYFPRFHPATTGDITGGSSQITNVSSNQWRVGHRIFGLGIPSGAYITEVLGRTFTISKNATATNTGVRLYDADVYRFRGTPL